MHGIGVDRIGVDRISTGRTTCRCRIESLCQRSHPRGDIATGPFPGRAILHRSTRNERLSETFGEPARAEPGTNLGARAARAAVAHDGDSDTVLHERSGGVLTVAARTLMARADRRRARRSHVRVGVHLTL